jgi:hypothetical protein
MRNLAAIICLPLFLFCADSSQGASTKDATFDFHTGFWLNLHHFLLEQAAAADSPPSDSPEWRAALAYYRQALVNKDFLSDEASEVNNRLSSLEDALSLQGSSLPSELIAVLDAAAPIYRTKWWPDHDRANRVWVQAVTQLVSKHGVALRKELAAAYATDWPSTPIRVDVAEYANWAGAYTTLGPTHITVSSADPRNQGGAALEILFHEASHAIVAKLRDALSAEAKAQNKILRPGDLWHVVLFYTTGEIVRRHLDGYTPYAVKNRLYDRVWKGAKEILDADWKPYLDGKIDMNTAIRQVVAACDGAP